MQLTIGSSKKAAVLLGASLFATPALASSPGGGGGSGSPSVSSGLYVRTDSDNTTVVTPQVHFHTGVGEGKKTGVDVVYIADIWTSASIDVRSAASRRVTEQRDEVDVGLDHNEGIFTVGVGYRYSHEVDYVSNGLSLSGKLEAFDKNSTFEVRFTGARDSVGRSGDATFQEWISTMGAWAGWTQVLTKGALLQLSVEQRWSQGYQASPYRFVAVGTESGLCSEAGSLCLPEVHPGLKVKNAAVIRGRQSLGKKASLGLGYRFYWDLWGIKSHTLMADISYSPTATSMFRAEYRTYTQSAAFFYKSNYQTVNDSKYITRDRELSKMSSNRLSVIFDYTPRLDLGKITLRTGLMLAGTRLSYADFVGLDSVNAFEASANLGATF